MSEHPRLPIHVGDYLKDTPPISRVNWEHHGIYYIALMLAWSRPGCRLPADEKWLAVRFGCSETEFRQHVKPVLFSYFKKRGGFLFQKRLTLERDYVSKNSKKQSANAKRRWTKENDVSHGNANSMPKSAFGNAPPPPPPQVSKKERRQANGHSHGNGNGAENGKTYPDAVTIKDPLQRVAIFTNWLAGKFPDLKEGWLTIHTAADPKADGHAAALELCKRTARDNGKGWPHAWPT